MSGKSAPIIVTTRAALNKSAKKRVITKAPYNDGIPKELKAFWKQKLPQAQITKSTNPLVAMLPHRLGACLGN